VDIQQQITGYSETVNVRRRKDATVSKEKVSDVEVNTQKYLDLETTIGIKR